MNTDEAQGKCAWCDNEAEHMTTFSDEPICADCSTSCDSCEDIDHVDASWYSVDNERWCSACVDNAYYCERCDEYSSESGYYLRDRSENWCDHCCQYYANWCDICEHYTADGCYECETDENDYEGNRVIHDYSYRPDIVLHSTKDDERLYFGFELEMELDGNRRDAAIFASQILEPDDYAYLKNDGSLDEGFELVTHPMSFDFLMDNEASGVLWDTISKLNTSYSARSYQTRTCGFHIHISRTGFTGGAHMHRFLNLVYSNDAFYSKLAGRRSDQWAKFTDVYRRVYDENQDYKVIKTFKTKLGDPTDYNNDRYSAINTRNAGTLEMRIFKGTLSIDALKAHIQLAHASVEYTRNLSVKDVREGALTADRLIAYIYHNYSIYGELISRLSHKGFGLDVQVPTTELTIDPYELPIIHNGNQPTSTWGRLLDEYLEQTGQEIN